MKIEVKDYVRPLTPLEVVQQMKQQYHKDGIALYGIELVEQEFNVRGIK